MAPQKSTGTVNESLKDDAFGVIQGFTGYSSALVSDLSAQIRARKRYDDEYLANKTRAVALINARNAEKLKELQSELLTLTLTLTLTETLTLTLTLTLGLTLTLTLTLTRSSSQSSTRWG